MMQIAPQSSKGMMMRMGIPSSSLTRTTTTFLLLLLLLLVVNNFAYGAVPTSATFKHVNSGEIGPYIVEYDGSYRTLDIFASPFQLCFYNTTPNAYTLALRMGLRRSESLFRWVWEANRGKPVKENATLTFGTDGNLVLADPDGRIAWQTGTANKGVVGFKLLRNGNMVLHDSKGKFIWQSFDYPTDTLLVGQALRANGTSKLVSRKSAEENSPGAYSLVMEPKARRLALYYTSPKSPPNQPPLLYYAMEDMVSSGSDLRSLTFESTPEGGDDKEPPYAYNLEFGVESTDSSTSGRTWLIARPKYNATSSILRLGLDGNLKVYTYSDKVDWAAWEVTFTLLARSSPYSLWDTECQLPARCGEFGLCDEDSQCVACPTAKGLLGWSKSCRPPTVPAGCKGAAKYFKLDGVDHFTSKYSPGIGPVKEGECGDKCSKDCKCLGYFYNRGSSRCWIAYDLKTLTKVENATHVGYIKM